MGRFGDRLYDVYVILGDPAAPPIWTASAWTRAAAAIDPLIAAARGRAGVRSFQLRAGKGSPNQRTLAFGRIGWNPAGHRKWVRPDPGASDPVEFISTEVWAPAAATCEKEQCAPDLFFGFRNEASLGKAGFNPYIIMAVATDQAVQTIALGREITLDLANQVNALMRAHRRRPWSTRQATAIGDYLVTDPFRPGDARPTLASLEEGWQQF